MVNKLIILNQKKHMLIGSSLIRIAFGFIILYNYAIHYSQRYFLWGPNGLMGHTGSEQGLFSNLSLYSISSSHSYFNIMYHIGILVALLFLFGYKGKATSILNFIFVWSLMTQNNLILDGGDNISRILLFYLLFAKTTEYFSIDAYLKRKKGSEDISTYNSNNLSLRNLIHNLAILACLTQVGILYLTSGLHKAMGALWQNGTALYYVLQVDEFSHPFFRDLIISSDFLLVVGAYVTVVVQLAFPFLLFNNKTKYLGMMGIIGMHLGIGIVMGLFTFSFIMISNQLLFLQDKEYRSIFHYLKQKQIKLSKVLSSKKTPQSADTVSVIKPIVVLYDGWCPFCIQSITKFKKLDWLDRIDFVSFRNDHIAANYNLEISQLEKRMHSIVININKVESGIYSINRICKNLPLLWILVPLLKISTSIGLGQKLYDWIANRRTIFPTGACNDQTCEIPTRTDAK